MTHRPGATYDQGLMRRKRSAWMKGLAAWLPATLLGIRPHGKVVVRGITDEEAV